MEDSNLEKAIQNKEEVVEIEVEDYEDSFNVLNEYPLEEDFQLYKEYFKEKLYYVEDETFNWDEVATLLVLHLSNADVIASNKDRSKNNKSSQITITGTQGDVISPIDFFPILKYSAISKGKIKHKVKMNLTNISHLKQQEIVEHGWKESAIQIKTRMLNQRNPTLNICYGDDIIELRRLMMPHDFLIFTRQKGKSTFEVFGMEQTNELRADKTLLISPDLNDRNDIPTFDFLELINPTIEKNESSKEDNLKRQKKSYIKSMDSQAVKKTLLEFQEENASEKYCKGDLIWIYSKDIKKLTHRVVVAEIINNYVTTKVLFTFIEPIALESLVFLDIGEVEEISELLEFF